MAVHIKRFEDAAVVIPEGTFTGGRETKELEAKLVDLVQEETVIVLNLSKTKWMNSVGMRVLVSTHKKALKHAAAFCVCEAPEWMGKVPWPFHVPPLQYFESCDEALKTLKDKSGQ